MFSKKGLVIEKDSGWAIIMLPDGEYKRIKTNQHLEIGEIYQYAYMSPVKYMAAAVLLLALLFSSIDYFSVKAYAQVSSLAELGLNRWGRVISVKATDHAGERILNRVEVKNDKLEVAIEKIYTQALQDKQINKSPEQMILSIDHTSPAAPELEKKMIKKMNHGREKAIQHQKQLDAGKSSDDKVKADETLQPIQNEGQFKKTNSSLTTIDENLNKQITNLNIDNESEILKEIEDVNDQLYQVKSKKDYSGNAKKESTEQENNHSNLLDNMNNEKDTANKNDSGSNKYDDD